MISAEFSLPGSRVQTALAYYGANTDEIDTEVADDERVAAVSDAELRGASDPELYRHAAAANRRIVTENIKDFQPILLHSLGAGSPVAPLVLVLGYVPDALGSRLSEST